MVLTLDKTSIPSLPGSITSSKIIEGEYPEARRSIASSPDPRHSTSYPDVPRNAARYSRVLLSSSTTRIDSLLMAIFLAAHIYGRQCEQKCRTLSGGTFQKKTSSMHPDNVVHTRQADCFHIRWLRHRFNNRVEGSLEN